MAIFAYKAKTKDGKLMKGKIESVNKKEALNELRHMDLIVFEVAALNTVLNKDISLRKSLKSKDFIVFLRQFSSLMNAGILLVDALDLLAAQSTSLALKEALEEISEEVREGVPLSEAMAKKPKLFPELLIHMIHSAEVSGRLEEVLQQMADYYEKQHRIKQKISTAMTYPLVVGVLAFFITAFLFVFIVPIFGDMFASMGSELPAITQIVLTLSGLLQRYWWLVLLGIGGLVAVIIPLGKKDQVAYVFDVLQLKVPILGTFIQKTLLARMALSHKLPTTVQQSISSIRRASSCIATSVKASVVPWKSSSTKEFAPVCTRGATAGCLNVA